MTEEKVEMDPALWVAEYGDYLFKYAYMRLGDKASAEDAVQETFLAAIKGKDRFDGRVPTKYWLRGILRHKVVDHIRKHARETKVEDFEEGEIVNKFMFKAFGIPERTPDPWKFSPQKAYERKEFWTVFYHCMDGMKGTMRQAFALRELEGQSTEEICKELGVQPNNLWVILHRARAALKECLEKNCRMIVRGTPNTMWMCRQVAKALADGDYEKLPPRKRLGLKVHVFLCVMCGKYHRQVMDFQDGVRGFLAHEEDPDLAPDLHLSDQAKDRIKEALHDA